MKASDISTRYLLSAALTSCLLLLGTSAHAASMTFNINADGIKEVNASGMPNGDPDGSAIGTLTLDNGTGSGNTGSAMFSFTLANIAFPLSAHHFHMAPPTTTGGVVLNFGDPEAQRSGNTLAATVGGLSSGTIDAVIANPTAFYYNLHNGPFPGGAVRDQLVPEPGTFALLGLGALGLLAYRSRRRAK